MAFALCISHRQWALRMADIWAGNKKKEEEEAI